MGAKSSGLRHTVSWCYRAIVTDSIVVAFDAIGFGVLVLSLMGRDGTELFQENGPIELVQAAILSATAICGALGYISGDERLGALCGVIAFTSAAFLLREMPRCESINSAICINTSIKRPLTVLASLGVTIVAARFVWRDRAGFLLAIRPRFAWPFYLALTVLVLGQAMEEFGLGTAEEVLELYAYTIIFQATTFLASAFLPRLNSVLSARRAIPMEQYRGLSDAYQSQ